MYRLIKLRFRALGKAYWLPPAVLFVLVPVISVMLYRQDPDLAPFFVFDTVQQAGALFCFWWLCFTLKEDFEGDGNELLYSAMRMGHRRFVCDIATLGWYLLHVAVLTAGYSLFDRYYLSLFAVLPLQCIFVWCLCYFCASLLQNGTAALMIGFAYSFCGMIIDEPQRTNLFVFGQMGLTKAIIYIAVCGILLVISCLLNKRPYQNR